LRQKFISILYVFLTQETLEKLKYKFLPLYLKLLVIHDKDIFFPSAIIEITNLRWLSTVISIISSYWHLQLHWRILIIVL